MNRSSLLIAGAIAAFTASAQSAQAGRGAIPVQIKEGLSFVTSTGILGSDGSPMALCLLTEQENALYFFPYSYTAKKYVLGPNNCDTTQFAEFNPGGFERAQQAGLIPMEVPSKPALSQLEWVKGAWGLIVVGLLIVGGIFGKVRSVFSRGAKNAGKQAPSMLAQRVLEAMCHAAKADGHLNLDEIKTILAIIQRMTGQALTIDQIKQLYAGAADTLELEDFKRFGADLGVQERTIVMEAVAILLVSDGDVPESEQEFLAGLAYGLDLSAQEVELIVSKHLPQTLAAAGELGDLQPA